MAKVRFGALLERNVSFAAGGKSHLFNISGHGDERKGEGFFVRIITEVTPLVKSTAQGAGAFACRCCASCLKPFQEV